MTSSSSNQSKFQAHTSPSPTCVRSFPTSDQPEIKEHSSMVSPVHSPKDTKQTNHLEVSPSSQNKDQELRSLCVEKCRDIILDLMHPMNRLCQAVRTANHASVPSEDALDAMAQLFSGLLLLAKTMGVNLRDAIHHKMDLNKQKYPVKLCKGRAGKYTDYSSSTGITQLQGQSLLSTFDQHARDNHTEDSTTHERIQEWWHEAIAMVVEFRQEREWSQFHTPRNIVLAMMGELGELAEVLQFEGDEVEQIKLKSFDNLRKEMADVAIYALSLTSVLSSLSLKQEVPTGGDPADFQSQLLDRI